MYTHNIAYRFNNGEVMGFTASSFIKEEAKEKAYDRLLYKLNQLEEKVNWDNEITSFLGLTKMEIEMIKKDWKK